MCFYSSERVCVGDNGGEGYKKKDLRSHVLRVHLQVPVLRESLSVFVYVRLRPLGQSLRSGECTAVSTAAFLLISLGGQPKGERIGFYYAPPAATPPFATRPRLRKKENERRGSLWTSLNVPVSSSLASISLFKFSMPCSLSQVICFRLLPEWQPSLRFVYFHGCVSDCRSNGAVTKRGG